MMEFLPLIGAGISSAMSYLGGRENREAAAAANAAQMKQAELNRQMQYEFAQHGIRWKVKDAEKAGIHPLYALGAQTMSYSPVSVGQHVDTSMGSAMASMGQDISRALQATRTGPERDAAVLKTVQDLELTNMGLKNELLATQIAKLKSAQVGPAMPDGSSASGDTRSVGTVVEGQPALSTPKSELQQQKLSDEYGDEGLPTIPGNVRFVRDWLQAQGYSWSPGGVARAIGDGLLFIDRNVKVFSSPRGRWQ